MAIDNNIVLGDDVGYDVGYDVGAPDDVGDDVGVMMLGPQPRVKRVGVETVPRGGRSYTQVQPGLAGTSGQNTNTKY